MKKMYLVLVLFFILALPAYSSVHAHRNFIFEYDVTINNIPRDASTISIWIPQPPDTSYQKIENISGKAAFIPSVTYDKKYKNKILYYCLKRPKGSSVCIKLRYNVRRYEYTNRPGNLFDVRRPYDDSDIGKYLMSGRLVTISPRITEMAADITSGRKTALDKAKAIYDYVFRNVVYDKTVPGWGRGDTERVCDVWSGNCTDFHSLFISLARASGIPARFLIGVPLSEEKQGYEISYHCWAEFYVDGTGWIPVDISEAWKDKTKYQYYFGTLDDNRIELTHGRDIVLEPAPKSRPLNYFVYPYVEIDGMTFNNVDVIFKFKDTDENRG